MRLTAADIERISEANIPKPRRIRDAESYVKSNAAEQEEAMTAFTEATTISSARVGEELPPPPRQLRVVPDAPSCYDEESQEVQFEPYLQEPTSQRTNQPRIPSALRGVDLSKVDSKASLIYGLSQNLPMNEYGLPRLIYRSDFLDWARFVVTPPAEGEPQPLTPEEQQQRYDAMQECLDVAALHLSYVEGFPALPSGEPLWAKLPFEDQERYQAFTDYCLQPGARQTARVMGHPHDAILCWYHEYYWGLRAKCYDMLQAAHAAKLREQRILSCEDLHFLQAERVLKKLVSMLDTVDWESLKNDPKQFVDVMERVAKLQRTALGLSQQGANAEVKTESLEVTMRRMASPGTSLRMLEDNTASVREILSNPEALASAQELIVRLTRSTREATAEPPVLTIEGSGG